MLQWHCSHHTAYREATPTGLTVYILTVPNTSNFSRFFCLQPRKINMHSWTRIRYMLQLHHCLKKKFVSLLFLQCLLILQMKLIQPITCPSSSLQLVPRHFKKHGQVVRRVFCTCPEVLFLLLSSRGCTVGCTDAWCSSVIDSFTAMLKVNFIQKEWNSRKDRFYPTTSASNYMTITVCK